MNRSQQWLVTTWTTENGDEQQTLGPFATFEQAKLEAVFELADHRNGDLERREADDGTRRICCADGSAEAVIEPAPAE